MPDKENRLKWIANAIDNLNIVKSFYEHNGVGEYNVSYAISFLHALETIENSTVNDEKNIIGARKCFDE